LKKELRKREGVLPSAITPPSPCSPLISLRTTALPSHEITVDLLKGLGLCFSWALRPWLLAKETRDVEISRLLLSCLGRRTGQGSLKEPEALRELALKHLSYVASITSIDLKNHSYGGIAMQVNCRWRCRVGKASDLSADLPPHGPF
jgi:hypothetical protein